MNHTVFLMVKTVEKKLALALLLLLTILAFTEEILPLLVCVCARARCFSCVFCSVYIVVQHDERTNGSEYKRKQRQL